MFQNYICEEFQPHSRKLKKVTNYLVWRHVISKFILLLTVKGGGCLVTAWFSLGDLSPWGNVCHSLHSDIRQLSLLVFPLGGVWVGSVLAGPKNPLPAQSHRTSRTTFLVSGSEH